MWFLHSLCSEFISRKDYLMLPGFCQRLADNSKLVTIYKTWESLVGVFQII